MNASERNRKFTLMMTDAERAMLESLASRDGLTASDWVRQAVRRAHGSATPTSHTPTEFEVAAAVKRHADPTTGLASVPAVVRELGPATIDVIVKMQDWIELRPESGMGRLSPAERAACPVAIDGTPLSWARIL